jgi:hypothetical protein
MSPLFRAVFRFTLGLLVLGSIVSATLGQRPVPRPPIEPYRPPVEPYRPPPHIDPVRPPPHIDPVRPPPHTDPVRPPTLPGESYRPPTFPGETYQPPTFRISPRQEVAQELVRLQSAKQTTEPWELLTATRRLQPQVELHDPSLRPSVKALEQEAAQRCVQQSYRESATLAQQGKWADAGTLAEGKLRQLGEVSVETAPLKRFAELKQRADALDFVTKVLAGPDGAATPNEAITRLSPVRDSLEKPVGDFLKLNRLQADSAAVWDKAPSVPALRDGLDVLAKSPESEPLARRLTDELAVKAFLQGHPKEANALLDAGAAAKKGQPPTPKEQAAKRALLRDMKTMILGEEGGRVQSWPAADALQARAADGQPPVRGPPAGAQPLLPEADANGWRPPAVERATEGLPAPKEALEPHIKARREIIETAAHRESLTLERDRKSTLDAVRLAEAPSKTIRIELPHPFHITATIPELPAVKPAPPQTADEDEDAKVIAEVEQRLGRKLTPAEKAEVKRLRRNGANTATIVDKLRDAAIPVDP